MRGRKPVPTTLRKLHGNPRRVPMPKFEPKPDGDLSDAPGWLNGSQLTGWGYALQNAPPGIAEAHRPWRANPSYSVHSRDSLADVA